MQFNEKITPDERWLLSIILVLSISAFIALTLFVRNGYLAQFDHAVLNWFHTNKKSDTGSLLFHFYMARFYVGAVASLHRVNTLLFTLF